MKPSIWGCFYGGRLDFFRTEQYKRFARLVVASTYIYRTDEQGVIGVAWSLLAGEKVWYLPKRGIHLGVYHHGWIDNSEIIVKRKNNTLVNITNNTLDSWSSFHEHPQDLISWEEYVHLMDSDHDGSWKKCIEVCDKSC